MVIMISFGAPLLTVLAIVFLFIAIKAVRKQFSKPSSWQVLKILLPPEDNKDLLSEIRLSMQLFNFLASFKQLFSLETAVHNVGEEISFYIAVPKNLVDSIDKKVRDLWPGSSVQKTENYTIFNEDGISKLIYIKQKDNYSIPIQTAVESGHDTFLPILNNFSKVELVGEGLAMQILAKPVSIFEKKSAGSKKSKPILSINARLAISAMSPYRAEELAHDLNAAFSSFSAPERNSLRVAESRNQKEAFLNFIDRKFDNSQTMILTDEELASIWHLPSSSSEIPKIKWVPKRQF